MFGGPNCAEGGLTNDAPSVPALNQLGGEAGRSLTEATCRTRLREEACCRVIYLLGNSSSRLYQQNWRKQCDLPTGSRDQRIDNGVNAGGRRSRAGANP